MNITDRAWNRIKFILDHSQDIAVKLSLINGGCAGIKYIFSTIKQIEDEEIIENGKYKFAFDKKIISYIESIEIDFESKIKGSAFVINNPKAKKQCKCGVSFNV